MKRKAISTRTRFEIFKRDGFRCGYCGRTPPAVILHIDHILAVSDGGSNDASNLVTACIDCNLGKSNKPLAVRTESLDSAQEAERERFEQLRQYSSWLSEKAMQNEQWVREISKCWIELMGETYPDTVLADDCEATVRTFLARLPAQEIIDALYIALARIGNANTRKFFKYFCGVCWRKIQDQ
jgi:hypothetical protein